MSVRPPDGGVSAGSREGIPAASTALPDGPAQLVPDWLGNVAALGWRVLVVAALIVAGWFVLTMLWTVTASVAVAIIVSAVFAPFVLRLRSRGRSRTAAAAIVWATAILVIGGALLLLVLAFLPYVAELVTGLDKGLTALESQLADLQVPASVAAATEAALRAVRDAAGETGGGIVAAAAQAVTVAILATFLIFFFLRDGDKAWVWLFQGASDQKRELISTAGDDALARVGGYLRGTTVLGALVAITNYAFMLLLDVPLALPLAVLSFLCGYIPYFGGIVSTAIILVVTLGALGTGPFIAMLVLMGVRSAILGYLVRPLVYGRTVHIHPAVVLVALPAGFQLGGVVGVFAAVPLTAVLIAVAGAAIDVVEPVPPPPLPGLVPAWLDRLAQFGWRALVIVGVIALTVGIVVTVPLVVIPIILALILAATLAPSVEWLEGRGYSRARSAALSVGGGSLLVAGLLLLALASLVQQAPQLADTVTAGASSASSAFGGLLGLPSDAVASGAHRTLQTILSLADGLAAVATITLIGILLAFYFLRDGGRLWGGLASHLQAGVEPEVHAAGKRAFDVLGGYMIGTGAISFVGAASQFVIMVVLGLPLALPIFVLSFFLGFIPYIGGFLSTGLAFLVAIAVGSTVDVLVMGIWTIVFNLVAGNIVSPLVYGRTVHIHPAIVLVAIPAGAAVAGPLGMFVVVPALGVVAATWRTVLSLMARANGQGAIEQPLPASSPAITLSP